MNDCDQLSQDSLPYYENQLQIALNVLSKLQMRLKELQIDEEPLVVVRSSNQSNMNHFQILNDLDETEASSQELLSDLVSQQQYQIEEVDTISQDLDKEIFEQHNILDQLNEELSNIMQDNDQRTEELQRAEILYQQMIQRYSLLQEQLYSQQFKNQNMCDLIERKKENLEASEQQKNAEREYMRQLKIEQKKRKASQQVILQQQILRLIDEKEIYDIEMQETINSYDEKLKIIENLINQAYINLQNKNNKQSIIRTPQYSPYPCNNNYSGYNQNFYKNNNTEFKIICKSIAQSNNNTQSFINVQELYQITEPNILKNESNIDIVNDKQNQKKRDCMVCGIFG